MEKQQQDGNVSRLSLDQRFSDRGCRSSARLRHQSLDRGMDHPSLDQRFGGTGQQLPTTAPHCRWTQASSVDQQPLDQRFGDNDYRLSATGLHHLKAAVEQQDNNIGLQLPMTATMSFGQQTMELYLPLQCRAAMDIKLHQVTVQARQPTSTAGPLMNFNTRK